MDRKVSWTPKITIAILAENCENEIDDVLDWIFNHVTEPDMEVLVFDNDSSDNTLNLCDRRVKQRIFSGQDWPDFSVFKFASRKENNEAWGKIRAKVTGKNLLTMSLKGKGKNSGRR